MKIDINRIPEEGLILEENISASELELGTETVEFSGAVAVVARISRITNAITVNLELGGEMRMRCGRCLKEFSHRLDKKFQLNYSADERQQYLDINPDIREEIILDYPIKPLCDAACKGLCPKCGSNLNEGGCSCATT